MRKSLHTWQYAFSMIELIFVIIILGIVSSIGAEIIANVYEQYIIQRAQHRASIKTELAATQIANRLAYAIPGTVIRGFSTSGMDTYTDINEPGAGTENVLQWVGADMDSFKSMSGIPCNTGDLRRPGWSGFCDLSASGGTNISTPGSNLALSTDIIAHLSAGGTARTLDDAQIYFPAKSGLKSYGVASGTEESIALDAAPGDVIVEHYKLAWTSYALVTAADGTLRLYYNFSPTIRAGWSSSSNQILLRNVSTFRMRGDGHTIRFKLCVQEEIGEDFNVTSCKEKAVF